MSLREGGDWLPCRPGQANAWPATGEFRMSQAEYSALESLSLEQLRTLPFWQFMRFFEACDKARRLIILQSLQLSNKAAA
jgi:hypothetical protein